MLALHSLTRGSQYLGYDLRHPLKLSWKLEELLPADTNPTAKISSTALENLRNDRKTREEKCNFGQKPN